MARLRKPVWILWIFLLLTLGKSAPFSVAYSDLMASAHCECCAIKNPDCHHCAKAKPKLVNKAAARAGGLYAVDCQGKKATPDFYQMFAADAFLTEPAVVVSRHNSAMRIFQPYQNRATLTFPILSPPPKSV